jgi:H+-transporting ATPase
LRICGLIAFADQPRTDSAEFVKKLTGQGIRVILITGDGRATAHAIASKVGIQSEVAPLNKINESVDAETISRFNVFSNVFPQEKFMLVESLQKAGHIVGMTGDGVNDAPALKQADVGIAVADSTDVAKSAAGLVLTKPGLSEILKAIIVSRKIFQRLQAWVLAMITRKVGIPMFIAIGTILFAQQVINPLQVVLFMFFGEIATFTLSMDNVEPSEKPRKWDMKPLVVTGIGLALLLFAFNCLVFWIGISYLHLTLRATQTLAFVWLVFAGAQAIIYSTRTRGFFWSRPHPSRALLYGSAFDTGIVTLMASQGWLTAAIPLSFIFGLLGLSAVFLLLSDIVKIATFRFQEQGEKRLISTILVESPS